MKDLFSPYAGDYAKFRPSYPAELFAYLYKNVKSFELAWDCGTGNGQTATELAKRFQKVYATDISSAQLQQATITNNIDYAQEPAEHTSLLDKSVNLITVSQALHWFDLPGFYNEVNRVASDDGILAAWTYNLLQVNEEVDKLINAFYFGTLNAYWDEERKYVDAGYANLPFPYVEIDHPDFHITTEWTLGQLGGYLSTWSGLKKFIKVNGRNPLMDLLSDIERVWPKDERKKVIFPLHIKMARVDTFTTILNKG